MSQFLIADKSALITTIICLILCGVISITINHTAQKNHRYLEQGGLIVIMLLLGLSLYNLSITDPNAINTCQYIRMEKKYIQNNRKHGVSTTHFKLKNITNNSANTYDFDGAIINTPRNKKNPVHKFWNDL